MDEKIAICFEHLKGNKFYYKRIAKEINKLFAQC
jgi:hypothetical protein